jgi:hypothetical protein
LRNIEIARAINDAPNKIAHIRVVTREARDGANRCPIEIVAKSAMKKVEKGAKYHCGVTAVELLRKAKSVTSNV